MDFAPGNQTTDEQPADGDVPEAELPDDREEQDDDSPEKDDETVILAWVPDEDDPEKPVADAVESNARMIDEHASMLHSEPALEAIQASVEDLQHRVDELEEENRQLRERIESLEGWKADVISRLDDTSENVRMLLTASDLDILGACPECEGAPLEKVTGLGQTNRIECADEDCGYIPAEFE
jgi:hypothetical protein